MCEINQTPQGLPKSTEDEIIHGIDFVIETTKPPFSKSQSRKYKNSILPYRRVENPLIYKLSHYWKAPPLYFTEFRDNQADIKGAERSQGVAQQNTGDFSANAKKGLSISRDRLAMVWVYLVNYLRFHEGLYNTLMDRYEIDPSFDYQGLDVVDILNDLYTVLEILAPIFNEIDVAMGILRKCESDQQIPHSWYNPPNWQDYQINSLEEYPYALQDESDIHHLTPVFIHAAVYAWDFVGYQYRADFREIADMIWYTMDEYCRVPGLSSYEVQIDQVHSDTHVDSIGGIIKFQSLS
ncbi:uncharacterized protein L201_006194 [Kwoniella dendrophila CBS 6074]|uniref:Uncharacterized protein n=1 Tax=Kwoniella dendrophila CBS 6074 TaxID=1295534 RepID=A0AAX4K107_9TREE